MFLITKNMNTKKQADDVITILNQDNQPVMYLFNAGTKGFLLLSASKLEEPILAYSTEAALLLNNIPRDLAIWIDLGVRKISQLNKTNTYYSPSVYAAWSALGINEKVGDYYIGDSNGNPILIEEDDISYVKIGCPYIDLTTKKGPLLGNIMWGQGIGYNTFQDSPPSNNPCTNYPLPNNKYYAGCVMVAFGQILKYYNDYGFLNLQNTPVVNRVMEPTPDNNGTAKILKAIFDITPGQKERNCNGTGAYIYNAAKGIKNGFVFAYSSATYIPHMDKIILWNDIVNHNRPVVLAGYSVDTNQFNKNIALKYTKNNVTYSTNYKISSGHAWVCDGHQEEYQLVKIINHTTGEVFFDNFFERNFYHMNWGWHNKGNSYSTGNGWYRDDLFTPNYGNNGNNLITYPNIVGYDLNGDGTDDGYYYSGYYYYRSMVHNIKP
ncbi:C10 family peptidase [Capnocytophaga sp. ARDL2]|uniref:C10 family peptidase n=1 Tax=Capnocytophaga sp. ARDL2 TaxID=3238809 RepID=UPI0035563341